MIFFSKFSSLLNKFDKIIKNQIQIAKSTFRKFVDSTIINKKRILFMTKLYRITFNFSFMLKFWNDSINLQHQMTFANMKNWIKNNKMNLKCSLYFYIQKIFVINFKLKYINRVLNIWNNKKNEKLLMLNEFVVIVFFVVEICLFLIIVSIIFINFFYNKIFWTVLIENFWFDREINFSEFEHQNFCIFVHYHSSCIAHMKWIIIVTLFERISTHQKSIKFE